MTHYGRLCAALSLALALFAAPRARAQERLPSAAQPTEKKPLSPYEQDTIRRVLEARGGAVVDPAPEGKTIEAIDVVPLDVLEDRDPLPTFAKNILNFFHATTRKQRIKLEMLESVGDPYDGRLIFETERNLRAFPRLSLVLIVPTVGSRPDRVRVVVITKDVWSLRLNTDWRVSNHGLEYFLVQPSEENLLGTHQAITGQFILDPATYSLGAGYAVPRIAGSHLALNANANLILNRQTGSPEGSFGTFSYGQPLWSTETEWSWGARIDWRKEVTRRYDYSKGGLYTYDAQATPAIDDAIPYEYKSDLLSGTEFVTRSFGVLDKNDFTAGIEVNRRVYRTADDLSAFAPAAASEFVSQVVPVTDQRIGPAVQWHAYSTRYKSFLDFNTLGLQEDFRLGHELYLKVYPVTKALNSSRDYLGIYASFMYSIPLGDGLVRAYVETSTEIEPSCPPNQCNTGGDVPDGSVEVGGRIVTPRFGIGRLVFDTRVLDRYKNYLNQKNTLGGDTRLRGYATQAFIGSDLVTANLEFRSRPVELFTVQLGAVAFFDTGDAFDGFENMALKRSIGAGLRALFPQLDRIVMRLDWGVPVTPGYYKRGTFPGELVFTFRQAFPMPGLPISQQTL